MDERIKISVLDVIGGSVCFSAESGQKVFDKVEPVLKEGKPVTISFKGTDLIVPTFLNTAVGQLYGSFSGEKVRSLVRVEGLSRDDMELLKRVVDNAKKYYANRSVRLAHSCGEQER